jgi:protease-4
MEKRSILVPALVFGGLLAVCFIFALILFSSLGGSSDDGDKYAWTSGSGPKIGVIEVKGVITDSRDTLSQLVELRRDPAIKAIVVRVDSPGGAVAPSQEIFHAIERARKDKKVVVSMGTLAASGGFYVSVAADKVYASPGTVTGSIGVISEFPDVSGLLDWARVKATTIKSGKLKDVGSPLRPMTDDEKRYFQGLVDGIYEQFLGDVARSRKLPVEEVRKVADGRVLSGADAKQLKLVDELGNLEDAIDGAAELAGAKGTPVPVFVRKRQGLLAEILRDGAEGAAQGIKGQLPSSESVEVRDPRLR